MFNFNKKKQNTAANHQKNQQNSSSSPSVKHSLLSLEQRLMFDAAAAATASEVASEQVAQEQAEAAVSSDAAGDAQTSEQAESQGVLEAIATYNPGESRSEVVFVDPTVPNYQDLLSGMNSNVEVIMLDGGQDGIEQMANALSGRSGIDAIHVISHGEAGALQLGTGVLNADSMSTQYADDLAVIQQSLSEQADILVYGCEFAQGEAGQAAVDMLAELTGADVQASNDLTGCISLGGDWEFEVSTGTIETSLAISYDAQMNWTEVLGKESVSDTFSAKSYGSNDGTRSWSSNWSEVDVGASGANGGHIQVNSGELRIQTQVAGASVSRGVDLSSANSATLSFKYHNDLSKGGSVEVRISTDGGANYRTISDGVFSKTSHTGNGTASFDISDHMSANTKIQFVVTGTSGGDRLFIDNVQVDYNVTDVNHAPTDITLTGGTVAENASTGTVVGTVAGTDADAGDTKTYSLTDSAGGRFAVDASTGVITVADGSALNYDVNASHSITVRVTDSGGRSYDETFTINLSNVDEGHTDLTPSEPTVVEPVPMVPEVEVVAGPNPVPDPVDGESELMVAVDPLMSVSEREVAAGPDPVLDPVDGESELMVAVDPLMSVSEREVAAGPDPVLDPVDGESVSEVKVAAGPDGVEPNVVVSLLQKSPVGSETVKPFPLPSSIGDDTDRREGGMTDNLQNPVEWSAQPAPTVDILDSGRNISNLADEGDKNPPAGAQKDGNFSAYSSKQDETILDLGAANVARLESSQAPWSPIEMDETVSDDSGGLNTPMAIGLIGAVLQGRRGTKEKMTDMRTRTRAPYQKSSDKKKPQHPHTDDQEAPPGTT